MIKTYRPVPERKMKRKGKKLSRWFCAGDEAPLTGVFLLSFLVSVGVSR